MYQTVRSPQKRSSVFPDLFHRSTCFGSWFHVPNRSSRRSGRGMNWDVGLNLVSTGLDYVSGTFRPTRPPSPFRTLLWTSYLSSLIFYPLPTTRSGSSRKVRLFWRQFSVVSSSLGPYKVLDSDLFLLLPFSSNYVSASSVFSGLVRPVLETPVQSSRPNSYQNLRIDPLNLIS